VFGLVLTIVLLGVQDDLELLVHLLGSVHLCDGSGGVVLVSELDISKSSADAVFLVDLDLAG